MRPGAGAGAAPARFFYYTCFFSPAQRHGHAFVPCRGILCQHALRAGRGHSGRAAFSPGTAFKAGPPPAPTQPFPLKHRAFGQRRLARQGRSVPARHPRRGAARAVRPAPHAPQGRGRLSGCAPGRAEPLCAAARRLCTMRPRPTARPGTRPGAAKRRAHPPRPGAAPHGAAQTA